MFSESSVSLNSYFSKKLTAYIGELDFVLKPTHSHEIVSAYLGFKSYAALRDSQKESGAFLHALDSNGSVFKPNYTLASSRIIKLIGLTDDFIVEKIIEFLDFLIFCEEKSPLITRIERNIMYSSINGWGSVYLNSEDMQSMLDYFSEEVSNFSYEESDAFQAMVWVYCNPLPSESENAFRQINIDYVSILLQKMKDDLLPKFELN